MMKAESDGRALFSAGDCKNKARQTMQTAENRNMNLKSKECIFFIVLS